MGTDNERFTRQDIDDVYKRNNASNSYKNRAFEGKRTARDEYTGERIYYSDKSRKGVKRHYKTSSTSNIDHVTPVDKLIERYSTDLTKAQIKQMANADYNLSNTNEALNKSKGAMTNYEYLKDKQRKGNPESFETTVRMLNKEAKSEVGLAIDSTRYRVKNKIEPIADKVSKHNTAVKQACYNFVGDTHVKSLDDRIAQTPKNNGVWSGLRGMSDCYPTDKSLKRRMKNKYGQDYVSYDKGEPDFTPFAVVEVKIPNMGERSDNFKSAKERILKTDFAKVNNLKTKADIDRYMTKNKLTLHEVSDGVTVQLVPTEINATFGHSGGVAEVSAMSLNLMEDGLVRTGQKASAAAKIKIKKSGVVITESIGQIPQQLPQSAIKLSNDFSVGALDAVKLDAAGIPILVEGAMNAVQVISGEKNAKEAIVDVTKMTSAVAASGGTTRVVTNVATDLLQHSGNKALQNIAASNQVAQIVGISMMLKDSFIDLVNGDIDGEEFLNQVNEKAIGLASNYVGYELATIIVGTGGAALIPALASMVVSTACVEIYRSIQNAKLRAELSEREWNRKYYALEQLAKDATIELHQQKEQLKKMMDQQFVDWDKSFESGFSRIFNAIQDSENSSEEITAGLQEILDVFDKNVAFKTQKEFDEALFDDDFVFVL